MFLGDKPLVCLLTCTKDRHKQLERVVRFALNQTYDNYVHLIFNNSSDKLRLNEHLPKGKFLLINSPVDTKTGKPYTTLGQIYRDAIRFIPDNVQVINFMDDDDIYFPDHVEEGVKGMIKGGTKAYKPKKSWFRYLKQQSLQENVLEPSIFVTAEHIKEYGFSDETSAQHHQWLNPLVVNNEIYVDPEGKPTYLCDWSQSIPTFKTSGDANNPNNFQRYSEHSTDKGDGVITPCSDSWAKHYYRL